MRCGLIVEDNPTWSLLLQKYCRDEGIKPVVAGSPQAAINQLDDQLPDLIILDMLLAAETGMALLNEMRSYSDLAGVPVVVCTSVDGVEVGRLSDYGVVAVLDKATVTPALMRQTLQRVAHG